jgi:hypothetical protein
MLKLLPLAVLFMAYVSVLPFYIQGGDTAELVAAAYHRLVAHPPGYPLYLWLQNLWLGLVPVSTVYWRASLLNAIFGTLALYFLWRPLIRKPAWSLLPLLLLGLKPEFIEASVLPDVFSLHALLVALVSYYFLHADSEQRQRWLPLLFWLSFANHHTTVLLLPCYLFVFWEARLQRATLLRFFRFSAGGFLLGALLYASLVTFNTSHPLSWGSISSVSDLIAHFLRVDYGTFRLAASETGSAAGAFFFLLANAWPLLMVALVLLYLVFAQARSLLFDPRFVAWTGCFALTLLFPLAMNVEPQFMGEEVLRRFHVMPLVVLVAWSVYLLKSLEVKKATLFSIYLCSLPAVLINVTGARHFLQLRNDSTIEDYARNLYREAKKNSPVVVVLDNDTAFFAIRYLQAFEQSTSSGAVVAASMPLFFHPWFLTKVRSSLPGFTLGDAATIYQHRQLNQDRQVIVPNLGTASFIFTSGYREGSSYEVTFLTLGRLLRPGSGVRFSPAERIIATVPSIEDKGPQHFTRQRLYYEYSHWFLARAQHAMDNGDPDLAVSLWKENLQIVPYSFWAMANLCDFDKSYLFCDRLDYWRQHVEGFY